MTVNQTHTETIRETFWAMDTMFINQTHTKTTRETFWATDTGHSLHTFKLNILGRNPEHAAHHRLPREQVFRTFKRRISYASLPVGPAEFADEHRSLPAHLLANHLGPNSRGCTPCPSTRRRPTQAGRRSGQRTQVAPCTRLAKHLGPKS